MTLIFGMVQDNPTFYKTPFLLQKLFSSQKMEVMAKNYFFHVQKPKIAHLESEFNRLIVIWMAWN